MSAARLVSHMCAGMLFGWELVLSFILVSVVYAVAIGEPSFGNIAPFAVGLSLVVDLFAGEQCAVDALQGKLQHRTAWVSFAEFTSCYLLHTAH